MFFLIQCRVLIKLEGHCFDSHRSENVISQFTFLLRFCWKLKFVTSAVFAPYPGFVKNDVIDHHLLRQGKHSHQSPSAVHGLAIHFETSFTALHEPLLFAPCLSYCRVCLLTLYSTTLLDISGCLAWSVTYRKSDGGILITLIFDGLISLYRHNS